MSDLIFSRSADGAPRASAENSHLAALAQFLESDLQDDANTCVDLLDAVQRAEDDEEAFEAIGNSYSLTFEGEQVIIENIANEDDEDLYTLPRETVLDAINSWLEFIRPEE